MRTEPSDAGKILLKIASGEIPDGIPSEIAFSGELIAVRNHVDYCQGEIERLRTELSRSETTARCLVDSERLYREVFAKSVVGIMIVTQEGRIMDANFAMESMLGFRVEELVQFNMTEISLPDDHGNDDELIKDLIEGKRTYYNIEKRFIRNDGILLWCLLSVFAVYNASGEPTIINMLEDISARKSAELHLQYMSTHDSLTGLYNRTFFDTEFNRVQFSPFMPVSIVVIDVDGLKQINDTKGHEAGDALIIGVSKVLKEAFRGDDVVARIGGDEFAAILLETCETAAEKVMERIRKCQERYNSATPKYLVNFSAGVATALKGAEIPHTFKKADERMYADKIARKAALKEAAEK